MTGILAIETATDACSIAVWRDGLVDERHEVAPRQHSQRLFGMLRELFPSGRLRDHGVDAIAWGCGPGSFTGLRIAASAVQGLAYSNQLPVIGISTLACQVQTAARTGLAGEGDVVLSTLDASIGEIYHAAYLLQSATPVERRTPGVCVPRELTPVPGEEAVILVGSGGSYLDQLPDTTRETIAAVHTELMPHAQDLVHLALARVAQGDSQAATEVRPVYVRDEINWKKLPAQGKAS